MPGACIVVLPNDPLFTIAAVNNAFTEATMTRRDKIVGSGLFEVFPANPKDPGANGVSKLHASLRSVISNRAPEMMALQKYDIPRPDGADFDERHWSAIASLVLNEAGIVEYIIQRVENVTRMVRLKEVRALRDSRERERIAVEAAQLGSWELDLKTGVLDCSHRCKANFGLNPDVLFTYNALLRMIHPEDRTQMRKSVEQAIQEHTDYRAEYRVFGLTEACTGFSLVVGRCTTATEALL